MKTVSKFKKKLLGIFSAVASVCVALACIVAMPVVNIADALDYQEVSYDFSDSAQSSDFTSLNTTAITIQNGRWSPVSWGEYALNMQIPLTETVYIAYDFFVPVQGSSEYTMAIFSLASDLSDLTTEGKSTQFRIYDKNGSNAIYLYTSAKSAVGWLASGTKTLVGEEHRMEIAVQGGKISYWIDGTAVFSSKSVDVPADSAYLFFSFSKSGGYIDNLTIEKSLDGLYKLNASTKDFTNYDKKGSLGGKIAGSQAWDTAFVAPTSYTNPLIRQGFWNCSYNLVGAQYYSFYIKNETSSYLGVSADLKEGKYSPACGGDGLGRWWTFAESAPYYLEYRDGTVKEGESLRHALNRGYAVVPPAFEGRITLPISAFEILDWAANTAYYDNFTEDANAINLASLLWADINFVPLDTSAVGHVTLSSDMIYGSYIKGVENSVNRVVKAIDDIGSVSVASESQIAFAREWYDALPTAEQANVTNYEVLTAAEETFYNLSDCSYTLVGDGKTFTGTGGVAFNKTFEESISTVSAWIKVSRKTADTTHVGTVVGNMDRTMSSSVMYDASNTFSFEITTNGNPKFEWRVSRTNKVTFIVENADVRTGKWMHVAFVRNADAGTITCYVNGAAVATMNVSAKNIADITFYKPVMVGSDYTNNYVLASGFTPDFNGTIADVRVYSSVLSESEIGNDMLGELGTGILGAIDFASGEAFEYYDYVNADATDVFGWQDAMVSDFEATDGEYTFAVIPDTQMLLSKAPDDANGYNVLEGYNGSAYDYTTNTFYKNIQWLIENKDALNLKQVLHVGDITDTLNYDAWATQGRAEMQYGLQFMEMLSDSGIPYALARGNHDGGYTAERLSAFDEYWTQSSAYPTAEGTYNENTVGEQVGRYTYYQKLTVGETNYLIVVLDLEPTDGDITWANEIIAANKDHRVIIMTHAYMSSTGAFMGTSSRMGDGTRNVGQTVWDELASQHENVVMVVSGHSSGENIVRKQVTGVNGNKVWNFMIDVSAHEFTGSVQPGVLTLMKFSADGNTVSFSHYSPTQGKLFRSYNQFSVTLGEVEETEDSTDDGNITFQDVDNVVLLPQVSGYTNISSSLTVNSTISVSGSPSLQLGATGLTYGTKWKSAFVGIDIEENGTFTFDADSHLTPASGQSIVVAVYATSAVDGLTRQIYPKAEHYYTHTAGETFYFKTVGDIAVNKGDKIVICYYENGAWVTNGARFNATVVLADGSTKAYRLCLGDNSDSSYTTSEFTATLTGLYNAGWDNGQNYNGYTVGAYTWDSGYSSLTYYDAYTVTVNDESGNMLFTAKAGKNGTLPALKKEGYTFLGYEIGGTTYAGGAYTVTSSVTAVAKFEKISNTFTIVDTDGKEVFFQKSAFSGALPTLGRTGHIFLGYVVDGGLYPAGTAYDSAVQGDTLTAVFAKFTMMNGAFVKIGGEYSGIRYQTYLDGAAYELIKDSVSFGTLIAKAEDITAEGSLDYSLLNVDATMTKLNIVSTMQFATSTGDLYFNGAIVDIAENHYDWKFVGRGYMTLTYADGTKVTYYADVTDNARSVAQIAELAYNDIATVSSKHYSVAVEGGYSPYSDTVREKLYAFYGA